MSLRRGLIGVLIIVPVIVVLFTLAQSRWNAVTLSLEASYSAPVLTLSGETNLPERTLLVYEVAPRAEALRQREGIFATGVTVVNNGTYRVDLDTSLFEIRDVTVSIRFEVWPEGPPQSTAVVRQFGQNGERISGEHLVQTNQRNWIELSESLVLDEQ
ncbi:hypothetical protein SCG7086_AU_00060 [Chlamydiales bacterium SCGC AG-110-P3]|nr:hypothetical protein SCG7086_AU_00060 [Chlamydiales bacterium SCGC AG-110-P3]